MGSDRSWRTRACSVGDIIFYLVQSFLFLLLYGIGGQRMRQLRRRLKALEVLCYDGGCLDLSEDGYHIEGHVNTHAVSIVAREFGNACDDLVCVIACEDRAAEDHRRRLAEQGP